MSHPVHLITKEKGWFQEPLKKSNLNLNWNKARLKLYKVDKGIKPEDLPRSVTILTYQSQILRKHLSSSQDTCRHNTQQNCRTRN